MRATSAPSSSAGTATAPATSVWSFVSWAFFGLTLLVGLGAAVWWAALRPAAEDPRAGPAVGVFTVVGLGGAWMLALACAALLCGAIGLAGPGSRTGPAWAAFLLNGAVAAVSLALLLA
jgi:hypothetical protein